MKETICKQVCKLSSMLGYFMKENEAGTGPREYWVVEWVDCSLKQGCLGRPHQEGKIWIKSQQFGCSSEREVE